ncbi:uncharacterized protein LOC135226942 [Macrobrachium nipponense]|uniref:uncharacterized protein LOC135226942 n=1 Tax=Macrobrachium nipponense TaxID=159736 RepID=UPI0030C8620D
MRVKKSWLASNEVEHAHLCEGAVVDLTELHNKHHTGIDRTLYLAKKLDPEVSRECVKKVVQCCDDCQSTDPAPVMHKGGELSVERNWQRLAIDVTHYRQIPYLSVVDCGLGGAVAVDCVSRSEISSRIAAMVLENTFTSIPDMAKVLFSNVKVLAKLPQWCHKNKYLSKYKMCKVVVPTLFLSGQADSLVPPRMMMELYHSCASPAKRLMQFTQGSHNETWKCPGYYQVLAHFLDEVFKRTTQPPVLHPGVVCFSEPEIL